MPTFLFSSNQREAGYYAQFDRCHPSPAEGRLASQLLRISSSHAESISAYSEFFLDECSILSHACAPLLTLLGTLREVTLEC